MYTADEVADTVVGILDKLGVKEACVVGHSYGAHNRGRVGAPAALGGVGCSKCSRTRIEPAAAKQNRVCTYEHVPPAKDCSTIAVQAKLGIVLLQQQNCE